MAESEWLYSRSDEDQQGPVSANELNRLAKSGKLQPDDLVWKQGMSEWIPASQVKGLTFAASTGDGRKPRPAGKRIDTESVRATFRDAQKKADEVAGTVWFLDLKFQRFVTGTIIQVVWTLYLVVGVLGVILTILGSILRLPIIEAALASLASVLGFVFMSLLLQRCARMRNGRISHGRGHQAHQRQPHAEPAAKATAGAGCYWQSLTVGGPTMNNPNEQQPVQPPSRPKRDSGATPPPRPKRDGGPPPRPSRDAGSPPPIARHGRKAGASNRRRFTTNPTLILVGVGLVCLIVLGLLLSSLISPSSTTAADYTSAEVREIIRLLREDTECRDTRIGKHFSVHNNSLELWERVLGKPAGVVGPEGSPDWTFRTKDGALTIHVGLYPHDADVPFVRTYSNGKASIGSNSNQEVDTESLKATIIGIKSRIDPGDSLAFQQELEEKWKREEEDRLKAKAAEQREYDAKSAKENERYQLMKDHEAAQKDYWDVRDELPVGAPGSHLWIRRRTGSTAERNSIPRRDKKER